MESEDFEHMSFIQGVMVLPVYLTKGLEFDAVLLWDATEEHYKTIDANAKLLYVAATTAIVSYPSFCHILICSILFFMSSSFEEQPHTLGSFPCRIIGKTS